MICCLLILLCCCLFYSFGYRIDEDSPASAQQTTRRSDGKTLDLVMSDEFNTPGRSFGRGQDEIFEAIERPDDINQAIEFYNSSTEYVTTENGSLVLITRAVKTHWVAWSGEKFRPVVYTKNYTSAMIQTWNKFCFTGGVLELSIKLPGHAYSGGLWPAAWLVGNLARASYEKSTQNIWPWSYDKCEMENLRFKQEINACDPAPGYGMHPFQGRGAPEIDIFEVMPGHEMPGSDETIRPFISQSLQVSPGVPKKRNRPINGQHLNSSRDTWYDVKMHPEGDFNYGFWGAEAGQLFDPTKQQIHKYQEDAVSVNTFLEDTHFEHHHVYRLEWQPGTEGHLSWYIDDKFYMTIAGSSIDEVTGAMVPEEPMYLILNTAISHQWGMPEPCDHEHCSACWLCYDCTNPECQCSLPNGMKNCKNLPAKMEIDFMRLYQDKEDPTHTVGCSPERFPTAEFILAHPERYKDWEPYTGVFPLGRGVFEYVVFGASAVLVSIGLLLLGVKGYYHYYGDVAVEGTKAGTEGGVCMGLFRSGYAVIPAVRVPADSVTDDDDALGRAKGDKHDADRQPYTEGKRSKVKKNDVRPFTTVPTTTPSSYYGAAQDAHRLSGEGASAGVGAVGGLLSSWPRFVVEKVARLGSHTGLWRQAGEREPLSGVGGVGAGVRRSASKGDELEMLNLGGGGGGGMGSRKSSKGLEIDLMLGGQEVRLRRSSKSSMSLVSDAENGLVPG